MPKLSVLEAAKRYSELGWKVFPIYKNKKIPLTPNGFHDSSSSLEMIEAWWGEGQDTNIGIEIPQDVVVVDVDGKEGLNIVKAFDLDLPETITCASGGGGFHYWYKLPGKNKARRIKLFKGKSGEEGGIDLLVNGYIAAPPSVHPSGEDYSWVGGFSNLSLDSLSDAPGWLMSVYSRESIDRQPLGDSVLEGVEEGHRNIHLFRYASKLRGQTNLSIKEAKALVKEAGANCSPPYDGDTDYIVKKVWERYPGKEDLPKIKTKVWSHAELMSASIPPPKRLVWERKGSDKRGMLPVGVTTVTADPKVGKSVLLSDLSCAICEGSLFLGKYETEPCGVLYYDLDGQSTPEGKSRWEIKLGNKRLSNLYTVFVCGEDERIGSGWIELTQEILQDHPNIGVVIADTWADIYPQGSLEGNAYHAESRIMKELNKFALDNDIALILVNHNSKNEQAGLMKRTSGTMALTGKSHAVWALDRVERPRHTWADPGEPEYDPEGTLHIKGKNIPEHRLRIKFDEEKLTWTLR